MKPNYMIGICVVSIITFGFYQFMNMRTFAFFPDGRCAYEETELGKTTCPDVMPDRYNTPVPISPDWDGGDIKPDWKIKE